MHRVRPRPSFIAIAALIHHAGLTVSEAKQDVEYHQRLLSNLTSILDVPREVANRCSSFDLAQFTTARDCGSPLSLPCVDLGRCSDGPSIYVYDPECTLVSSSTLGYRGGLHGLIRRAADEAGVLAETYESACMFINVDRIHVTPCATTAPLWKNGANHVMIDINDPSRDTRPSYSNSYAMEAATSQHTCYYRSGYDISIGHFPKVVFPGLATVTPSDRKYFLTFRGTLYLNMHGFEERASLVQLHNDSSGVVVAQKCCRHCFKIWPASRADVLEEYTQYCAESLRKYEEYDFESLMNTTFALVPAGASPGTHRLPEVMSAGAIPVIVARDWVRPFSELVDWPSFSFTFSPDEVPNMLRTLKAVPAEKLKEMQMQSLQAYWKIYHGETNYSWIAALTIKILKERLGSH